MKWAFKAFENSAAIQNIIVFKGLALLLGFFKEQFESSNTAFNDHYAKQDHTKKYIFTTNTYNITTSVICFYLRLWLSSPLQGNKINQYNMSLYETTVNQCLFFFFF